MVFYVKYVPVVEDGVLKLVPEYKYSVHVLTIDETDFVTGYRCSSLDGVIKGHWGHVKHGGIAPTLQGRSVQSLNDPSLVDCTVVCPD